jgi:dimethylhistidine N-methyltransferase
VSPAAGLRLVGAAAPGGFARDLVAALETRPRAIAPKYFYDAHGSMLFERICELPEYYLTRTELGILVERAGEIAALMGAGADLVEFGAGSLHKVRLLLAAMNAPARFVPIDISAGHLQRSVAALQRDHPGLVVQPVVADFAGAIDLPQGAARGGRRVGFFPGSTLGNFAPDDAVAFLRRTADLLRGGALVLGADLIKDPALLHAAYNDGQQVTAAFNLNLLARANRELAADFDLAAFAHSAFYNAPLQRIEMHLVSRRRQVVHVGGRGFEFAEGETIHTENSYKFTVDGLRSLATAAGFTPGPVWIDARHAFSVHWLQAPPH